MNFGLFYYCQGRGVPHDQAYAEMLDEIVLAEALGFEECWFAEHHFTDYSLLPSPFAEAMIRPRPIVPLAT
jgi:alkanesulfonate monooxygenase SsuD/methylene tetrahydromethanopterin reductase-like flavin-dependent oxidoreductase (luciferase family)